MMSSSRTSSPPRPHLPLPSAAAAAAAAAAPPVFASRESQVAALKQLIRLNNEGSCLLRSSVVKGRDAMALFQTALTTAVDLTESCDRFPFDEDSSLDHPAETLEVTMDDLCRLAPVPLATGDHDHDHGPVFYFYHHVIFLNPAGVASTTSISLRSLARLYLVVLLLNSSLACYQLGHTCLRQPTTPHNSSYVLKAQSLFRKSLELYSQLLNLSASDIMTTVTEPAVTQFLEFGVVAATNNYTLVCLQQGYQEVARNAQRKLCGLLQRLRRRPALTNPPQQQQQQREILQEILLNTTIISVTDFHDSLAAGAA